MKFPCVNLKFDGNLCTGEKISDDFFSSKPDCSAEKQKQCMKSIENKKS